VASGCTGNGNQLISEDAQVLWQAAGRPSSIRDVCPQTFRAPLAPHLAARAEGKEIDADLLRYGLDAWRDYEIVIVEGAGGLMSPLGDEEYVADLATEFAYPLIVVAPNILGVINQTLQTLITAATFRDGLPVAGVVMNDVSAEAQGDVSRQSNFAELKQRCVPPLLAHVRWNDVSSLGQVDWFGLACQN
jgi:dethiobiotin synthetase